MKILLLTGDHPRHLYLADTFSKTDLDIKWVIEKREPLIPVAKNISKTIKKLYEFHFHKRAEVEKNFFYESGELAKKKLKLVHEIKKAKEINSELKKICDKFQPDLLIAYGSGIINDQILDRENMLKWNVHLGLSPWYRGGATHFWPSYLLEPEFTGITVHEMTKMVDAGPIIHQQAAELNPEDGIHENACRLTKSFCDLFPTKLQLAIKKKIILKGIPQIVNGRNFTQKLWKPEMLKIVYEFFNDRINKYCIDNNLSRKVKTQSILNDEY